MSTPAENVTELHPQDRPVQTSFEGFPVEGYTDTLKSLKSKPTDKIRPPFQHVEGWFKGRVKALSFPERGEGTVGREHIIEVLEWGTEE